MAPPGGMTGPDIAIAEFTYRRKQRGGKNLCRLVNNRSKYVKEPSEGGASPRKYLADSRTLRVASDNSFMLASKGNFREINGGGSSLINPALDHITQGYSNGE